MKVLYAIQGTGNGHIARSLEIVPLLHEVVDVDVLISGCHNEIATPFNIEYKLRGMGFIFGKRGGIDYFKTARKINMPKFAREVAQFPIEKYHLVINDFEPVTAWASRFKKAQCIGLSHQNAVLHPQAPRPNEFDPMSEMILKQYAPTKDNYGFHFKALGDTISTPIIRQDIRDANVQNHGHFTVYLPAWSDEKIIAQLTRFPDVVWEVFSKHTNRKYQEKNVKISPVSNDDFVQSFTTCEGIVCNAGFETPAEALYMGKKLLVIPMKNQYEQQCNAAMLKEMGVETLKNFNSSSYSKIEKWLNCKEILQIDYSDNAREVVHNLVDRYRH